MNEEPRKEQLYGDANGFVVEVIGPLADPVRFSSQGGGFVRSMPRAKFEEVFKPYVLPGFHKVLVTGDWLNEGCSIEAFTDGRRWNGWATPHFTLANAKLLLAETPNLRYDEEKDAFIAKTEGAEPGEDEEIFQAEVIDVEGSPTKVYAIGAFSWTWEIAEPEQHGERERGQQT